MEEFRANGFVFLQREPREVIVGIGAPAGLRGDERIADPEHWKTWNRPGWIKAATNFRAEPAGEGRSRLVTETQVEATDERARRRFRVYWLAVGQLSALEVPLPTVPAPDSRPNALARNARRQR